LVDGKGQLIAGHGRALAAQLLGVTDVPTIRLEHLTEAQSNRSTWSPTPSWTALLAETSC
jgi:ParB-like chromosome segregation protein Spo0J